MKDSPHQKVDLGPLTPLAKMEPLVGENSDQREKWVVIVRNYGAQLATLRLSKLELGERLILCREVLEKHRLFAGESGEDYLLGGLRIGFRTAYRYMKGYENATARLPGAILRVVMERDLPMYGDDDRPLGRYTSLAERYPPPTNPSRKDAEAWLELIEEKARQVRARRNISGRVAKTLSFILKETEVFLKNQIAKLAACDRELYYRAVKKIVDKL